jgi:sec-independent protein translocase protein TatA
MLAAMFGLGMPELIVILVIIMIVFGVGRLPELGSGLGQAIKNFRKATREPDAIDVTPPKSDDQVDSSSASKRSPSDSEPRSS